MSSSTKLFLIALIMLIISTALIYKGLEPQLISSNSRSQMQSSSSPLTSASVIASIPPETQTNSAEVKSAKIETYPVAKVVDGDTIVVEIDGVPKTVRLIGINTPETVDPRKPVQCFGAEASNETKHLLQGKRVSLEKDISETDKYNRLLRFVYLILDDGSILFVNDYLVREGFAYSLTYPPDVSKSEQFKQAENQARQAAKGLWANCEKV